MTNEKHGRPDPLTVFYRGTMLLSVLGGSVLLAGSLGLELGGLAEARSALAGLGLMVVGFGGLALW